MNNNESNIQINNVNYNKNILLSIINLATTEINGVAGISKVGLPIFKNKDFSGIKVKFNNDKTITIAVYIDVYHNYNAPDVCFRVQENIKNNIMSMINLKSDNINIHIVNVIIGKEENNENTSTNSSF